jgi:hypothetical protein
MVDHSGESEFPPAAADEDAFDLVVSATAQDHDLPEWLIRGLIAEYLACRQFGTSKEIWRFIPPDYEELENLLSRDALVIACTRVFHNVRQDVPLPSDAPQDDFQDTGPPGSLR